MNPERLLQNFDRLIDTPDAIPRLRRFILDLAVRGKLVEQNPEDEPAENLLVVDGRAKGIRENNRLIEHLPKGWKSVVFGQLISLKKGKKPKNLNEDGRGLPYLDIAALERGEIRQFTDDYKCPQATISDIVIVCDGSRSGLILEGRNGVLGSTVAAIQFTGFTREYLRVLLSALYENLNGAKKGAAIPHLNIPRLLSLETGLPPFAEQHRIVAKVDELMKLCDELEAVQAKRERRRDSLVAATLHGMNNGDSGSEASEQLPFEDSARFYFNQLPRFTTHPEHIQQLRQTILNLAVRGKLIPAGMWKKSGVFGDFVKLQNGYAFKSSWFTKSGIRLCRNMNVGHGNLNWLDTAYLPESLAENFRKFNLTDGDLVLSLDRPIISTGLKIARLSDRDLPCLLLQRVARAVTNSDDISLDYVYVWFKSSAFLDLIDPGRSNGVPHISTKQVEALPMDLPPFAEQYRIVAKVDELMKLCDEMETRITTNTTTSRKLLEATLQDALSGVNYGVEAAL